MHPSRRRKKRPNYGIRTVEVVRGPNGFGFTISGQQPCILSCIVANSPADQAGLRAGDFLISVNGVSVSKITHDAVVNLIGNSIGPIRMTIAENYYSDSSDEELEVGRMVNSRKPKYMHKPRGHRLHKNHSRLPVDERMYGEGVSRKTVKLREPLPRSAHNCFTQEVASNSQNISPSLPMEDEAGPIEYKALVGYLGTIEMPKQLLPNSRLQTVCSCIRKLRQEKRTPTAVLMTILPTCLTLKNSSNHILAIYPMNRVVYVSSTTDKESRYFGLVTSAICDNTIADNTPKQDLSWPQEPEKKTSNLDEKHDFEISNSCHVFVIDPKIIEHPSHAKKAESFKIICTPDEVTGYCMEFPKNALTIVSLIQNMYRLEDPFEHLQKSRNGNKNEENPGVVANSPQPSASSNSDSGIGFRDDCGNISDRILVVEFPAHRPFPIINSNLKRPSAIDASKIPLETLDLPLNNQPAQNYALNNVRSKSYAILQEKHSEPPINNLNNIRAYENVSIRNAIEKSENFNRNLDKSEYLIKQNNEPGQIQNTTTCGETSKRLTVRAMPDPRASKMNDENENFPLYSERAVDVPGDSPSKKSCESVSLHSMTEDLSDFKSSVDNISVHSSKSFELSNLRNVFKTPHAKYLESKRNVKRQLKMVSSCDDLVPSKYEESVLNYKLSPKVYGVSKPNYSCEELNNLESSTEKCGYGSLQDLSSWDGKYNSRRHIAQSEPDVRWQRQECEKNGAPKCSSSEGPASWATSFEKLLEDPLGLHKFAEFLKKEFSAENIYFWTACERYRKLPPGSERTNEAQKIYKRHLCVGAPEPVNVDARGRQYTEQALQDPDSNLFEEAQKQIYKLMKFDSYPRFLKSDLYKQCLSGNTESSQIDTNLLLQPVISTPNKLKKSLSNAEDRRRKSLLPWHRKNRSKSKDRGESEYNQKKTEDNNVEDTNVNAKNSDIHSSKSSLTSLDLAITSSMQESVKGSQDELHCITRGPLCRINLNNGTTTIVAIKETETIQELINRHLQKRGLTYSAFEVFTNKHHKSLDVSESSAKLAGCEVTVEQRVVFKLDLPNRKVIAVKSKYTKILMDVLRPILHKYNYNLEQVKVTLRGGETVDIALPVTSVDGMRLNIEQIEGNDLKQPIPPPRTNAPSKTLDEITNKVYEDILQEKSESGFSKQKSDKGSVKSEDWGSEHSSGIFGRFMRRDSGMHERKKKALIHRKAHSSEDADGGQEGQTVCKKPLIAKLKSGVKLQVTCSESDELYEGLSRALRSRLEDQRGTEINFELPDFLKDKESAQHTNFFKPPLRRCEPSKLHTSVTAANNPAAGSSKTSTHDVPSSGYENATITSSDGPRVTVNNNVTDLNNKNSYAKVNNLRIYSPNKFSSDESSNQSSPSKCDNTLENTVIENKVTAEPASPVKNCGDPPPLPPKPKILPIRPSNWGQNGLFKNSKEMLSPTRSKQTLYLEQPTSSFV